MGRAVAAEPALLEPGTRVEAGAKSRRRRIVSLSVIQKANRAGCIGGSDAAMILGVSPYGGPLEAYLQIRGLTEVEENEAMRWGNLLEEPIAREWARRHGVDLVSPPPDYTHHHPDHSWMIAHPDYLIAGKREGLEIKNIGEWSAAGLDGPAGATEPLPAHLIQCHHYMEVLDYDRWHLACLVGGNRLVEFTLERDRTLGAAIIERLRRFHDEHLAPGIPPPHTDAKDPNACLAVLFPQAKRPVLVEPTPEMRDACELLRMARADAERAEAFEKQRIADVKALLGDAEGVAYDGCRITWRCRKDGVRVFKPKFWMPEGKEER
jgi:putative phage-type endonuclease